MDSGKKGSGMTVARLFETFVEATYDEKLVPHGDDCSDCRYRRLLASVAKDFLREGRTEESDIPKLTGIVWGKFSGK